MKYYSTFSFRITAMFLLFLLLMGFIQAFFTLRLTEMRQVEIDQRVNRNLADKMAVELKPILDSSSGTETLEPAIHYMMVLNPSIEVYLLNEEGVILAFFAPFRNLKGSRVDTDVIRHFISGERKLPLLGDDPRNTGSKKHFSAAPVTYGSGEKGYLYIILRSTLYDQVDSMLDEPVLYSALIRSALLSVFFVGIVGVLLFRLFTLRLKRLTVQVTGFSSNINAEITPLQGHDEVSLLSASFRDMSVTIKENMEALSRTDQERRELVANISHDLRSPLTSIRGYAETLQAKRSQLEEHQVLHYLGIISHESERVDRLISDLFDLSRFEAGLISLRKEVFSITELVQDTIQSYKSSDRYRSIRFESSIPEKILTVHADLGLIDRVLGNLIDNAVKFSDKEGLVTVSVEEQPDRAVISVSDRGQGIEAGQIPLISARYVSTGKDKGSGLGLAIVNQILSLHDSVLEISSKPEKGSTFSFSLNLKKGV